ncbi:MAG: oxamate carbamoyltransferase subunit AllH family protein [Candidatus Hodarchaeales archaeon]|jgi:hypothetical protein
MSDLFQILSAEISVEEHEWLISRIEPMLYKFQKEICGVSNSYHEIMQSPIPKIIPNLLGMGEGSTPQSDDFFLGIITVKLRKEPSFSPFFSVLSLIKYESYTTRSSASLIRAFLRENYPEELKPFIELLATETLTSLQTRKVKLEIDKIKRLGASSGYTFLVGVLWQLRLYENQRQNLIRNDLTIQD